MAALHFLAAVALAQAAVQQAPPDPVPPAAQDEAAEPGQAAQDVTADLGQAELQQAPPPPPPAPAQVAIQQAPVDPMPAVERPLPTDARIQLLAYDPNQIVTLGVSQGYASIVELAADERVENLVVGNSAAWQVTANRRGDRVIVKPLAGASPSNMIVLTASRRYVFVLDPSAQTAFVMRFTYPAPVQAAMAPSAPEVTYRFRGDKALFPLAMSDDARRTVVRWGEQHSLPAVFAMTDRTHERLVNGRMVGNDYVIEGAAARYIFRYGKSEAIAIRQTPKRRR